ncbi:hypothetical protein ACJJTC_010559 [Scirpophaga incertulas]
MRHVDALSRNPVGAVMRCVKQDLIENLQQDDDSLRTIISQLNDELSKDNLKDLAMNYIIENGHSPMELLYGFRPRVAGDILLPARTGTLSEIRETAVTRTKVLAERAKAAIDQKRRSESPLRVGQVVLARRKVFKKGLRSGKLVQRCWADRSKLFGTNSASGRPTERESIIIEPLSGEHGYVRRITHTHRSSPAPVGARVVRSTRQSVSESDWKQTCVVLLQREDTRASYRRRS